MALIENLQREDLNPIDEATAYRRLADEFHLTQDAIAAAVGKDRSTVANTLRLLRLPDEVRAEVATGRLSMGHARALLGLPDEAAQRQVGREVIAHGLSVRETEALVKKALEAQRLCLPQPRRRASRMCTRARPKRSCACCSGPACGSCGRARKDASRSTSSARTS
jgi:ParB family transcriptional regulator, chromosome partitioning protein